MTHEFLIFIFNIVFYTVSNSHRTIWALPSIISTMCLFLWYRKFCYSASVSLLFAMNRVVLRIQIIEMQSCFFSGEKLLQIRSDKFFMSFTLQQFTVNLLFWLVKLFLLGKTEGRNTLLFWLIVKTVPIDYTNSICVIIYVCISG